MSLPGITESLNTVVRRPALLAVEIAWRWVFGCVVLVCLITSGALFFYRTKISGADLAGLASMSPEGISEALNRMFAGSDARLGRLAVITLPALCLAWTLLAGIGRAFTMQMIVQRPVRFLPVVLAQAMRATLAIGSLVGFSVFLLYAARIAVADPDAPPRLGLYVALVLLDLLLVGLIGSAGNWLLWLWSITGAVSGGFAAGFRTACSLLVSPAQIEIQTSFGFLRLGLLLALLALSSLFGLAGFVLGGVGAGAPLALVTVVYLVVADLLQISRVVAIASLVTPPR